MFSHLPSALTIPPGSSQCFGLRVIPVHGDTKSVNTGGSVGGYNIWRNWEDCLWFQDMLELRYGVISREKRQRLQAGKGVKKNGIYIHDRAASFESLPPGPDPKSVAMDVHQYLPRLTKRGALFRQTQQTINLRQNELDALLKAFFKEDVPSLIQELRQDRIIRDFFGYWRRDYDLACKEKRKGQKAASDTFTFSTQFSQSSLSLSFSSSTTPSLPTKAHRSPSSSRWRPRTTDSVVSLSDSESAFSRLSRVFPRHKPSSAPACVVSTSREDAPSEDEHPHPPTSPSSAASLAPSSPSTPTSPSRSKSHRSKTSSSTRTEEFNVASDFPLFFSTSTRELLPSSRPPHSPTYAASGLGTLPEDGELSSPATPLPPPTPRNRRDTNTDRAFRNCIIWNDNDEATSGEGDVLDRELHGSVDGSVFKETATNYTSGSSHPSSVALSKFSPQSRRSSWRSTSSDLAWPASSSTKGSPLDPEFPHWVGTDSLSKPACPPIHTGGGNGPTMYRSLPGGRRRSISQSQTLDMSEHGEVGDGGWLDLGDDFIDTYFGGSEDENPLDDYVDYSGDLPLDVGEEPADRASFFDTMSLYDGADVDGLRYLFPLPLTTAHPPERSPSPQSPQSPISTASTPTLLSVPRGSQMVNVKAVLDHSIVVFRARRDIPLAELRRRVHEKFARTEGIALHGAFALAYVIATDGNSASRASSINGDISSHALPIWNEEDWEAAVTGCGSKITIQVYYPS